MHLSRILDQIKRHPSPTEALTKLGKAMDKHEDNLLEKGFRILKSELCANVYEAINGPHFDEEHARYAVEGMENEDGSKGPHWTVEETTSIANQMGINLKSEKHNKWDWYVVKGDSTPLVGSEISAGNRYWVYYNKCDNVIQVMNHYTVAAAPAA